MKHLTAILLVIALFSIAGFYSNSSITGEATYNGRVFEDFLHNVRTTPIIIVSSNASQIEISYAGLLSEIVYKRIPQDLRPRTIFRIPLSHPQKSLHLGDTIGSVVPSLSEEKMKYFGKPVRIPRLPFGALSKEGILIDEEAEDYPRYDKIIVGNPCNNEFMHSYLYYFSNCTEVFSAGNKFVKIFSEEGKKILILGAKTDADFRELFLDII